MDIGTIVILAIAVASPTVSVAIIAHTVRYIFDRQMEHQIVGGEPLSVVQKRLAMAEFQMQAAQVRETQQVHFDHTFAQHMQQADGVPIPNAWSDPVSLGHEPRQG